MANHNVVIINQGSTLVYVDLTDNTLGTVEINHSDNVDAIYKDTDGTLYVDFDNDGGRMAKYHHDGVLGAENTDYSPALVGAPVASMPDRIETGGQISPGYFLGATFDPANWSYSNFTIKNTAGTVIDVFPTQTSTFSITDPYNVPEAYTGILQFLSTNNGRGKTVLVPSTNSGIYFQGFYWFLVNMLTTPAGVSTWSTYLLKCTRTGETTMDLVAPRVLLDQISSPELLAYDVQQTKLYAGSVFLMGTADGKLWIAPSNTTDYYSWDGVSLVYYSTPEQYYLQTAAAARATNEPYSSTLTVNSFITLRDVGWTFETLNLVTMVKTQVVVPPMTALPAEATSFVGNSLGMHGTKHISYVTHYSVINTTVKTMFKKLIICDILTGVTQLVDLTNLNYGYPCPLARLNFDKAVLVSIPAYKVTGKITKDGTNAVTELVLFDNLSQKVIGRTKSDPVTGDYYFRCWTAGNKSILAQHPVSKGMRIAAESMPVLEA